MTAASSMKTVQIHSAAGRPNPPTLALRVEKPPVPIVENAWARASTALMPAFHSSNVCTAVSDM